MVDQGRFAEAEQLARQQMDVYQALGSPKDAQQYAATLNRLASIISLQGRWKKSSQLYDELEAVVRNWEGARRETLELHSEHIVALYNTDNVGAGLSAATRLLARQAKRYGEQHIETAITRGLVAIGLYRSNHDSNALHEFKSAIPILIARSRETDDNDAATIAAREQRAQFVIESYIALLAHMGAAAGIDAAAEGIRARQLAAWPSGATRAYVGKRAIGCDQSRIAKLIRKAQIWKSRSAPNLDC